MIVVDASALLEVLLATPVAERVRGRILAADQSLHAPHLVDLEIAQVLRRYCAIGDLGQDRAATALDDLSSLTIERYPHNLFLSRIWELRHNLTAYDAAYVALAEALEVPLVTSDRRLAASSGHRAAIESVT